jgi:hypothetical protein
VLGLGVAVLLVGAAQLSLHAAGSTAAAHADHVHAATVTAPGTGLEMLLAHLMSAAMTVLALVWQERAVLAVARVVTPPRVGVVVPSPVSSTPPLAHRLLRPLAVVLDVAPRRGPPTPAASALAS